MKKLVFFSGAGMSAESGISTFRDSNGLWENYDVKEVATPEAWNKNPELVQSFYNARRKNIIEAKPNDAHFAIATLEEHYNIVVITQNIDDLHERAGSSTVLHLHGNIRYAKSSGPNQEKKYYAITGDSLTLNLDLCDEGFPLRPHVVWFGEQVPMYETVIPYIENAEIFVVIGTSLNVYPAAGLINYCNPKAKRYIIDPKADEIQIPTEFFVINKPAVEGMIELLNTLLIS